MLINLTNHPHSLWDENQLQAAKQYGECIDMPFPQIDPEADEAFIDKLSDEFLQKIKEYATAQHTDVTVHLMGELTFSFILVEKLKNAGIPCISSTSARNSKDLGEGQKEITFKFVRFRYYF